ncbi:SSI family serine proteinase inhibitor [Streptosporangium roseum]|uniref:SSI family serine proteinase inhibitor n=1 Tax=Streptosporangium roseum TaxID=2001 RepID=UPI00331B634C
MLSIAQGESMTAGARHILLVCDPPYGTHSSPVAACASLTRVGGDLARLRPLPNLMCTMSYEPVTVAADGVWNGRTIHYRRTFGNSCSLAGTTGPIFL